MSSIARNLIDNFNRMGIEMNEAINTTNQLSVRKLRDNYFLADGSVIEKGDGLLIGYDQDGQAPYNTNPFEIGKIEFPEE